MNGKETALEMYRREHVRWNQWALFFFGSIGSLFVAWSRLSDILPLWIPALIAFLLSCAWASAALSIRATTDAWEAVIQRLEDGDAQLGEKPFHIFREELKKGKSRWRDLYETLGFWRPIWWREYMFSVTRLLTLVGLVFTLCFLALAGVGLFSPRLDECKNEPIRNAAAYHTLETDSIDSEQSQGRKDESPASRSREGDRGWSPRGAQRYANNWRNRMDTAILIVQVLGTLVIAATLIVYFFQLRTMREASNAQNILAVVQCLQTKEARDARGTVRKILKTRDVKTWTDIERDDAATTCSSYDVAAILAFNGLVDVDLLIEHWGPSIKECFEVCKPYIDEMRSRSGPKYWDDFELLYERLS